MPLAALLLFTAWIVLTLASSNVDGTRYGQSEFRMGVVLPRQQQQGRANLQAFSGALGGAEAPAITNSGNPERPYEVDGDTFPDYDTAANRACDNQKNACADMANTKPGVGFKVSDCDRQNGEFIRPGFLILLPLLSKKKRYLIQCTKRG
ncbi:hypothetical protein MYCTH_2297954 [Thermothelomyces thermophilus ATCC 42464]|uniref:Uncharacterized protein n=1 Tax=Thermothelomyces thermophilus (strain ATCC 42464 / BCRC 31852 / DSM 1799) TaxID=573729 RepID=G2Q029_THET4|nr:uncharacterized protein MYCTH_2297954 [Thermothelomyces thermophilus ATCC 42464]AEO54853.1 hypothetical protein MYCTH_2297954 [Thermothelomyces thermophilus ATCC 42464]